jgi:NAD(P)-dependent dehydrogenase (short-subunit alcohol dehydrogenase family)
VIAQPFDQTRPKGWEALFRANYLWLLHSTQQALPLLRSTGRGGSIINITSIEAHRAAPGFAVYAGFKAAVTGFTKSLAVELAPEGIRVNTIEPDMVPTDGIRTVAPDDGAQVWEDTPLGRLRAEVGIPMARPGRLEDVGGAALFLASDLSSYVTGTSLHPDGGVTAAAGFYRWPEAGWTNVPPAASLAGYLDDPGAGA